MARTKKLPPPTYMGRVLTESQYLGWALSEECDALQSARTRFYSVRRNLVDSAMRVLNGLVTDSMGDEVAVLNRRLREAEDAIRDCKTRITRALMADSGITPEDDKQVWGPMAVMVGEAPFDWLIAIEPGTVVNYGEIRTSHAPEHSRVLTVRCGAIDDMRTQPQEDSPDES